MELPKRKRMRLRAFDYAANGAYFVTICTYNRQKSLSTIRRGDPCGRPEVALLPMGRIADAAFQRIEKLYPVTFDYRVIMPDHVHFIVFVHDGMKPGIALGRIVGAYKSVISNEWLKYCKSKGVTMGKVWQRDFYDHVIRNEQDLQETRRYIEGNPDRWCEKE